MAGIVVAFPKPEDARSIKNILVRNGYQVAALCLSGAQAINAMDDIAEGILITGYNLKDMIYTELLDYKPKGFDILVLASARLLSEKPKDVCAVSMPMKIHEFISTVGMMVSELERRRRRKKNQPKSRDSSEKETIASAKALLMERNGMSEEEAHRYIQKCSMDSSTNMVETSQMILISMG